MADKKVTKREYFTEIVNVLTEAEREDLAEVMTHEIELLDKKASKAKEKAAEKKAESDELAVAVAGALTDEFQTIAQVAEVVGEVAAKVQYRLTQLVKTGMAVKEQITVDAGEGKTRKVMGYKVAEEFADEG